MREIDAYTSPLDDFVDASDYALELPEPGGLVLIVDDEESSAASDVYKRQVLVTDFHWRSRVTRSRSVDRSSGFPRRGSPFWRVVRIDRACAEKTR